METLKRKYNTLFEYALLVTGTLLLAIAVTVFLEPSELVTGGVSGIGIIIRSVTVGRFGVDVPLWLTNIILNIPLFILGAKTRGLAFLGRTLFSTILFSPALFLTSYIPRYITALSEIDLLLAAVFGGGGHKNAAGASVQGTLDESIENVLDETIRTISKCSTDL